LTIVAITLGAGRARGRVADRQCRAPRRSQRGAVVRRQPLTCDPARQPLSRCRRRHVRCDELGRTYSGKQTVRPTPNPNFRRVDAQIVDDNGNPGRDPVDDRRPKLMMRNAAGFTLIEVLVAMTVMAVMAMMAWQGVDGIVRARDANQSRLEQTLRLNSVIGQWEQDLALIRTPASCRRSPATARRCA
jgi:prepilin-type N-terminal cleavage/methylation domain-containing protein